MSRGNPYPSPSSTRERYSWADSVLEPKQQHRFLAYMPVFSPGPMTLGDIASAQCARQVLYTTTFTGENSPFDLYTINDGRRGFEDQVKGYNGYGQCNSAAKKKAWLVDHLAPQTQGAIKAQANLYSTLEEPIGIIEDKWRQSLHTRDFVSTRISPYIVSSFKPPSIRVDSAQKKLPGLSMHGVRGTDMATRVSPATITLVSTLQDDLQWSLMFLWALGTSAVNYVNNLYPSSGLVSCPLFPPLATDINIVGRDQTNLVIKEITADKDFANAFGGKSASTIAAEAKLAAIVGRPVEFEQEPAGIKYPGTDAGTQYGPGTVGYHVLSNPVITNISFKDYTYEGADFIATTLELSPSTGDIGFYDYVANTAVRKSSKKSVAYTYNTDGTQPAAQLNAQLKAAYANYPLYFNKSINLRDPVTEEYIDPPLKQDTIVSQIRASHSQRADAVLSSRLQTIRTAAQTGGNTYNELVSNTAFARPTETAETARERAARTDQNNLGAVDMNPGDRRRTRRDMMKALRESGQDFNGDAPGRGLAAERRRIMGEQEARLGPFETNRNSPNIRLSNAGGSQYWDPDSQTVGGQPAPGNRGPIESYSPSEERQQRREDRQQQQQWNRDYNDSIRQGRQLQRRVDRQNRLDTAWHNRQERRQRRLEQQRERRERGVLWRLGDIPDPLNPDE